MAVKNTTGTLKVLVDETPDSVVCSFKVNGESFVTIDPKDLDDLVVELQAAATAMRKPKLAP